MTRNEAVEQAIDWAQRGGGPGSRYVEELNAFARMSRAWSAIAALLPEEKRPAPPDGLCANRDDHEPHVHEGGSLGTFRCTADQAQREPNRSEQARRGREDA